MTLIGGRPPQAPEDMKAWENLVPGSANKLFEEYICQLQHRRKVNTVDMIFAFYGPALGFIIVLVFLSAAVWLINKGFSVEGTVLGSVDIASLAAVFAIGNRSIRGRQTLNDTAVDTVEAEDLKLEANEK